MTRPGAGDSGISFLDPSRPEGGPWRPVETLAGESPGPAPGLPDPDALATEDQAQGAPARQDPLYFTKRKLAFFIEQGRRPKEIQTLLGLSKGQYRHYRKDPLTKRFLREFQGNVPDPTLYQKTLLQMESPEILERHIAVALDPSTPPNVANDARKDLLDREGTLRRHAENGAQTPLFQLNVEQLTLVTSSLAHELALPEPRTTLDITPEKVEPEPCSQTS